MRAPLAGALFRNRGTAEARKLPAESMVESTASLCFLLITILFAIYYLVNRIYYDRVNRIDRSLVNPRNNADQRHEIEFSGFDRERNYMHLPLFVELLSSRLYCDYISDCFFYCVQYKVIHLATVKAVSNRKQKPSVYGAVH